ncbi:PREDICTED: CD99 antigen-like protein 2, partial [Apaloderma vittatum]|uniref:CD99 antigen-like protein 2 n=1 Tax=Apaloderma vittatum TaxID=57397 RepID=UPI000521C76E
MLEQFMKNSSPWKGLKLEKFVENCLLWEEPQTGAGECDVDDFNLEDALDVPKRAPPTKPKDADNPRRGPSARPKDSGGFDDSDLYDGSLPKGEDNSGNNASQGAIAGIVSAVFATVLGTVSSFIAYQKKKLCFKQSGQRDFDLADALDHPGDIITRKPTVIRRPTRPVLNNDLHLGDALGGGDISRKPLYPPLPPRPGTYSNSGGFADSDLLDGKPLPPHIAGEEEHNFNHGGNTDSGLIAGVTSPIISAFVILVVGSIAAYSAYKNKKLCFKPQ